MVSRWAHKVSKEEIIRNPSNTLLDALRYPKIIGSNPVPSTISIIGCAWVRTFIPTPNIRPAIIPLEKGYLRPWLAHPVMKYHDG